MSTQFIALEEIRVATPCRADWDKMQGDDRSRFCQSCAKNVYSLSEMTRNEAETLVREKEGQLCVRFFQRADGTVLTTDCAVGTKSSRRMGRVSAAMLTILAAPFLMVSAALAGSHSAKSNLVDSLRKKPVVGALVNKISPQPSSGMMMTGAVAVAVAPRTAKPRPAPTPNAPLMGEMAAVQPIMGKPAVPPKTVKHTKSKTAKSKPKSGQMILGRPTIGAPLPPTTKRPAK